MAELITSSYQHVIIKLVIPVNNFVFLSILKANLIVNFIILSSVENTNNITAL